MGNNSEKESNQPPNTEAVHIDDWIDDALYSTVEGLNYAAFFFFHKRLDAVTQMAFAPFLAPLDLKLFCTYNGKRYRCTGASRLGDVWLTEDFKKDVGYSLRVYPNECSDWSKEP